jgi:hypothetical protein
MKAWELLSDKSKWCQGVFARDSRGKAVWPDSNGAVMWSVVGAIAKLYGADAADAYKRLIDAVGEDVVNWNDWQNHEDKIATLKELDI